MSSWLTDFCEYIAKLKTPSLIDVGGLPYSCVNLTPMKSPVPTSINCNTLGGFVNAVKLTRDKIDVIVIDDATQVSAYGPVDAWGVRPLVLRVTHTSKARFNFGAKIPPEDFLIALRATFAQTSEMSELCNTFAVMGSEVTQTVTDQGVCQAVQVKRGVHLGAGTKALSPIVKLKMYRTFLDIDQPEAEYVIRVHADPLAISLHESINDFWRDDAIALIESFLLLHLEGAVPVIS